METVKSLSKGEAAPKKPRHIVQIGYDSTAFLENSGAGDIVSRHTYYADTLENLRPASTLTQIILLAPHTATPLKIGKTKFIPLKGNRITASLRLLHALHKLHKAKNIDVLTTQTIYEDCWCALLFGWIFSIPVVAQEHSESFSEFNFTGHVVRRSVLRLRHFIALKLIKRVSAIRTVSPDISKDFQKINPDIPSFIIPVPITLPLLENTSGTAHRMLFVGRLDPQKNVETWLDVAAVIGRKFPDASFDIVGKGNLRTQLEKRAHELGIDNRVTFHGSVSYEQVQKFYTSASVVLAPSIYEGFGRVLIEALTCGAPVVTTNTAGPRFIFGNSKAGILLEPYDVKGMSEAIINIFENPSTKQSMISAAQPIIERFSLSRLTTEWMNLLLETADRSPDKKGSR